MATESTATGRADVVPFGPGSLLWDGAGDRRMLLVLGGALIMQAMHPTIGEAISQTREYATDPWGRFERSINSVQRWVYGGAGAFAEGERLRELHKKFSGTHADGTRWRALDPEPWAWVHNTVFERAVVLNRYFSDEPLTGEPVRRMYEEVLQLGRILHVPERMLPPTVEEYWSYFDDMVANKLTAHPAARDVLQRMVATPAPPSIPRAIRAAWKPFGLSVGRLQQFVTVGTFPPAVREILGLTWSDRDEQRLRRFGRAVVATWPHLPERVRYMPIAYRARRAAARGGTTRAA
ncbi:MAG: DUF2236 domain-containing protein [Gemmatimonadetes bacterium]|nr:DUF2236 domain-containing protein [Gemmatimonadota bacterium]